MTSRILIGGLALLATAAAPAAWHDDLATLERGLAANYANFEYGIVEARLDLPALHAETAASLDAAADDAGRRAALRTLLRRFRDPHIGVRDLVERGAASPPGAACDAKGAEYAASAGLRRTAADAKPVATDAGRTFDAAVAGSIGIVRIPTFVDRWWPVCGVVAAALDIAPGAPCDDACVRRLSAAIKARLSRDLAAALRDLEASGARTILIDLSGNGGGGDWAEVAARIVGGPLPGARLAAVRHPVWVRSLTERIADIDANRGGGTAWQARLTAVRATAARGLAEVGRPCDLSGQWRTAAPLPCSNLSRGAVFTTGFEGERGVAAAPDAAAEAMIWSLGAQSFEAGATRLPVAVLVDRDTHSAAEQMAARLQDHGRAVIVGEVSAGSGCGHAAGGGNDIVLPTARLVVEVPDCARLRRDGSNERRGIAPDLLLPFGTSDSPAQRAATVVAALPRVVATARRSPSSH